MTGEIWKPKFVKVVENESAPDGKVDMYELFDENDGATMVTLGVPHMDGQTPSDLCAAMNIYKGLMTGDVPPLVVGYTNWKGIYSIRRVRPIMFYFMATEWHPEPQWLLRGVDVDRKEARWFAVKDIKWDLTKPKAPAASMQAGPAEANQTE